MTVRVTVGARVTPTLPPKPKPNPKPKPKPKPNPSPSPNQGLFDKFPECGHDYHRADNGEFEVDEKRVNELLAKRLHARLGLGLGLGLGLTLTLPNPNPNPNPT